MKDLKAAANIRDIRRKFLEAKAASEGVLQLQDMLDAMEALGADREECILALCEACKVTRDEMREMLSGDAGEPLKEVLDECKKLLDLLRENDGNEEAPEAKSKPDESDDRPDMAPDHGSDDEETKKPKKAKKPKADDPEDAQKSVAVPGNGTEMQVQTDVQSILTQNNVLLASLITEVQKLNELMTQYLAAEVAEENEPEDKPEDEAKPEAETQMADGEKPAVGTAPAADVPPPAEGGKTSDEDEATSKIVEQKLAEIKATLAKVKKTASI
jgi:hypothetical protein